MSRTKEQAEVMMEAKRQRYFERAMKAIERNDQLVFVLDLAKELGIDRRTINNYYPAGTDRYNAIMEALENNKTNLKQVIREKLLNSNLATALIALYRLIGTTEEKNSLLMTKQDDPNAPKQDTTIKLVVN